MHLLVAPFVYFAGAAWFYLFSGMAEGLTPVRLLVLPIFLTALVHAIAIVIRSLRSLFNKNVSVELHHYAVIVGLASLLISFKLGLDLDDKRITESMRRGDVILSEIREFKDTEARCPADLDELRQGGVRIPEPALKMSKFRYWVDQSGQCLLSFDSVLFTSCRKYLDDGDWYCD